MTERVRLVIAGAGAFGCEHLRIGSGLCAIEWIGVADVRGDAARDAAERFGVSDWGTDAAELVARLKPDGLVVASSGPTHVPLALFALGLGIPVLVEKPVAPAAAEAATLLEAERRSSSFVMPGHILRFSNPHRTFREIARSAAVGMILSITARRHRDESHASRYSDDPVLMTMIHDIDLVHWITGERAVDVLASRYPEGTSRSETIMTATDTAGAVWRLSTAWTFPLSSCPPDRIEVIGERGSVELEVGGSIHCYGHAPREIDISAEDPDEPHVSELSYFAECIRSGTPPGVVTLADAAAGLATADAIRASLTTGERVRA